MTRLQDTVYMHITLLSQYSLILFSHLVKYYYLQIYKAKAFRSIKFEFTRSISLLSMFNITFFD